MAVPAIAAANGSAAVTAAMATPVPPASTAPTTTEPSTTTNAAGATAGLSSSVEASPGATLLDKPAVAPTSTQTAAVFFGPLPPADNASQARIVAPSLAVPSIVAPGATAGLSNSLGARPDAALLDEPAVAPTTSHSASQTTGTRILPQASASQVEVAAVAISSGTSLAPSRSATADAHAAVLSALGTDDVSDVSAWLRTHEYLSGRRPITPQAAMQSALDQVFATAWQSWA